MDIQSIETDIRTLLGEFVQDVTSQDVAEAVHALAQDAAGLLQMKVVNASDELISDAQDSLNARVRALSRIPELAAAKRSEQVFTVFDSAMTMAINLAFRAVTL